jgi:pimeloyl-ACP methyl ester carboxylesterase
MPLLAARGIRSFALSFRGHGASGSDERLDRASLADYVADARSAVRAIGAAPVLVGHSLGGLVAQLCLGLERIRGLVLMAPVPPDGLLHPNLFLAVGKPVLWIDLARFIGEERSAMTSSNPNLRQLLVSDDMPSTVAEHYLRRMHGESRRALLEAHFPQTSCSAAALGIPALVVGAERDLMIPPAAVARAAWFHAAELNWIPEVAHALMLDLKWCDAADVLLRWITRKFGARS